MSLTLGGAMIAMSPGHGRVEQPLVWPWVTLWRVARRSHPPERVEILGKQDPVACETLSHEVAAGKPHRCTKDFRTGLPIFVSLAIGETKLL